MKNTEQQFVDNMMKKKVYIAGPLFNDHERDFFEAIALNLQKRRLQMFSSTSRLDGCRTVCIKDNIHDPGDEGQNICCRFNRS